MMRIQHAILSLYAALLELYPLSFRLEFGAEMRAAFADCLQDASGQPLARSFILFLRELRDLPGSLLREHLSQRRKPAPAGAPRLLPPARRFAANGALGFGAGMSLMIFSRLLLDPIREQNLVHILLVDILLFVLLGALGGALLGSASRSALVARRMALASALGFGLGILPADILARQASFSAWACSLPGPYSFLLKLAALSAGTCLMGSLTGALFGLLQHNRLQARRLALTGGLGFGLASIAAQALSALLTPLFQPSLSTFPWLTLLTILPLGAVGGAILGWTFGEQPL